MKIIDLERLSVWKRPRSLKFTDNHYSRLS